MPNINREDKTSLESTLTVSILKEDFQDEFKKELKNIAKTKTFKGFRPGKTPVSFVKKMYGNSILNSVIQKKMEEQVNSFMEEGDYIASPIPAEGQEPLDITLAQIQDQYDFVFHIGHKPEINIDLDSKLADINKQVVDSIPESQIQEVIDNLLTSKEKFKAVEGEPAQEMDKVTFEIEEKKENGTLTSASLLMTSQVTDGFKEMVLGKNVGDVIEFNINEVLKDSTPEKIQKFLFQEETEDIAYDSDTFTFKILLVDRLSKPELNDEFVESLGEEELKTVDDLKKRLEDNSRDEANFFLKQKTISKIFHALYDSLDFELPKDFLEKYMTINNQGQPVDNLEGAFKAWRWQLFLEHMAKEGDINVSYDEVMQNEIGRYMNMGFGNYPGMEGMIRDMLSKQFNENPQMFQEAYEKIYVSKVLEETYNKANLAEESVPYETYKKLVEEEQEKQQQNQMASEEE